MLRKIFALMTVLAFTVCCAESAIASESQSITKVEQVKANKGKAQQKKAQVKKQHEKKHLKKNGKK